MNHLNKIARIGEDESVNRGMHVNLGPIKDESTTQMQKTLEIKNQPFTPEYLV